MHMHADYFKSILGDSWLKGCQIIHYTLRTYPKIPKHLNI